MKRRKIVAPIGGMVAEVAVQQGEAVTGGQMVVRIVNLDKLRVKAVFDSEYALAVKPGLQAEFIFNSDDSPISSSAEIVFVSPEIRASEKVFEVWADIDNSKRELLPGFKGELKIELE